MPPNHRKRFASQFQMAKQSKKGYLKTFRKKGEEYYKIKLPSKKQVLNTVFIIFLVIGLFNLAWMFFVTPILAVVSFAWVYFQQTGDKVFINQVSGIIVRYIISILLATLGFVGYKLNKKKKNEK